LSERFGQAQTALAGSAADGARQRIMRATLECFREHGYEKSSMKRISARAGVSQALLHYHFETKAKLFESTMDHLAHRLFEAASAQLPRGKSVHDGLAEAADVLYTLFVSNLDAVTFMVEFAAAANHTEFLRTAYVGYRDTQRRQLADLLRDIAGDRAPSGLIDEAVRLIETGLLGMSMQRPFISDETSFRADFDAYIHMVTSRLNDGLQPVSA
jgi:AcrR family transcriptional regulator